MTRHDLDGLQALLDKATPGHHPLSTAESAAHHMANAKDEIVRALPALLAYVRELERERDRYADGVRCPNCDHLRLQLGEQRNAALAMRERAAQACEELSAEWFPRDKHEAAREGAIMRCAAAVRALEV